MSTPFTRGVKWRHYPAVILLAAAFFSGGMKLGLAAAQKTDVVHIVSDRLEAHQRDRQVVFLGHVVATQGDLTIKGDRLTIFYMDKKATEATDKDLAAQVDRIVIEGNVRISQNNTVATGQHAVFYSSDNKVVLTGEPRVRRDKDVIQGTSITHFFDSDKSIVDGGPSGRVEATIFTTKPGGSFDRRGIEGAGDSHTDRDQGG